MAAENEIVYGGGFLKDARALPKPTQKKLAALLELLLHDAFEPRLHTKPLSPPLHGKYSFRITRDWRVIFEFIAPHTIYLLAIDRRDRIYKRFK